MAAEAARLRPAPVQEPQAAPPQGPDGLLGPLQGAAVQSPSPEPPAAAAAAQGSAERLPSTSPPAAEPAHQVCMVPDTPVSDSVRDNAPDVQQWEVSHSILDNVVASASLDSPLFRPDGLSVGDEEPAGGTLQSWAAARPCSPDLQHAHGKADVRLSSAPESADDLQQGSALQLVLDLQLSGTQSMCSEPQGMQSNPHIAGKATPDPERAAAEAMAASLPAAALAPEDPLSGCLKQSGDRETPLVQCAQLAADLSTGDSSRRALAVRSALGAAQKVSAPYLDLQSCGFRVMKHFGMCQWPSQASVNELHLTAWCCSFTSSAKLCTATDTLMVCRDISRQGQGPGLHCRRC